MSRTNIRKRRFVMNPELKPTIQTFRHDFGEKFMEELKQFAIIHKYDDRKVFKQAWIDWTEQKSVQIAQEVEQLKNSGYKGDVLDKMFKSARYYFRKKVENVEETPRKKYISLSPLFLEQIDIYISERLSSSPADLYCDFCQNKKELIFEQIQELIDLTSEEICIKLKKTFKNRFYVLKATIQSRAQTKKKQ
jgi:hypothetical protein